MCQPTIANAQTAFFIILQWITQLGLGTVAFHVRLSPHTNAAVEVESHNWRWNHNYSNLQLTHASISIRMSMSRPVYNPLIENANPSKNIGQKRNVTEIASNEILSISEHSQLTKMQNLDGYRRQMQSHRNGIQWATVPSGSAQWSNFHLATWRSITVPLQILTLSFSKTNGFAVLMHK